MSKSNFAMVATLILALTSLGAQAQDTCQKYSNVTYQHLENSVRWSCFEFEDVTFADSNMKHSHFIDTKFSRVLFRNVDLYGSTFGDAILAEVMFENANLNGSNFRGTDLRTTTFGEGTTLNGSAFDKATQLPLEWGTDRGQRYWRAVDRGMLPVRE